MFRSLLSIIKALNSKEFTIFLVASAFTLLSGILLLIQLVNTYTVAVPAEGGTFTEGAVGQIAYLNPVLAREGSVDRDAIALLFATAADIAGSVQHDDSFREWTMRIKDGAVWHDGTPITSDDIIFTVQTIQNADTASPLFGNWQHVTARRVSEREIQFETLNAYALFPNLLSELRPIPKKYFADLSPANIRLSAYNLQPIGSGPFTFDEMEKRTDGFISRITMERNASYGAIGNLPHLDRFTLEFFENEDAMLRAFNRGHLDGIGFLYPAALEKIDLNANRTAVPTSRYYALFFNANANPLLASKEVRRALQLFTDKEKIAREAYGGYAVPQPGPLPAYWQWQPESRQPSAGNADVARGLLASQGWFFDDETKTWNKVTGETVDRLTFSIKLPDTAALLSVARNLREQWEAQGIQVEIMPIDSSLFTETTLKTRDYEIILYGNVLSHEPDLTSFWHSNERFYPGLNFSMFENATADTLLTGIKTNAIGSEPRQSRLNAFAALILEEQPAAFLISPQYVYVTRTGSVGVSIPYIASPSDRFDAVHDWHVRTKRIGR